MDRSFSFAGEQLEGLAPDSHRPVVEPVDAACRNNQAGTEELIAAARRLHFDKLFNSEIARNGRSKEAPL
jgi:hypothetical protein